MKAWGLLGALLAIESTAASAAEYQNLAELDARIAAMIGGNGTSVPIDPRIKLAKCGIAPEISPVSSGAMAVRCPDKGWRLAVAVNGVSTQAAVVETVVHRGDTVEVLARGNGFSVSSTGLAMDEGAVGRTIRVKMPTSSAPLSATITRAGVVSISF